MDKIDCKHTHFVTYVSFRKCVCIDCGYDKPLNDLFIEHQR